MKKIIILPLGFILVHVFYLGCCKCIEGTFFRQLTSIRALHYSRAAGSTTDTVRVNDTLFTTLQFRYDYTSRVQPHPLAQLVNAAYATSCNCSNFGDSGYKYRIDSIIITSNKPFNGLAAGTNLSLLFKGMSMQCLNNTGGIQYVPLQQLLDSTVKCRQYDSFDLICPNSPGAEKIHQFTYRLFSNGKSFETNAAAIVKWN